MTTKKLEDYFLINFQPKKLMAFGKIFEVVIATDHQVKNLTSEFSEFVSNPKIVALHNFGEPEVELDKFSIFWKEFDKNKVWESWKEFDRFDHLKYLISHRTIETSLSAFIELILAGKRLKKTEDDNFAKNLKDELLVISNFVLTDSIKRSTEPIRDNNLIDILQHNHLLMISYKYYKMKYGEYISNEIKTNATYVKLTEAIASVNETDPFDTLEKLKELSPPIQVEFKAGNLKSTLGIEVSSKDTYRDLLQVLKKYLNVNSYFLEDKGEPKISESKFVRQWVDKLRLFTSFQQINHSKTGQFSKLQTAVICPIFLHYNIGGFPTQYSTQKARNNTKSSKQYWEVLKGRLDTFA